MIPRRLAPLTFGALMSAIMTFFVSGISTWRAMGSTAEFLHSWMASWGVSWLIACPLLLVIGPPLRRFVDRLSG